MQALALHADARDEAREAARTAMLERRLARYQPRFQTRVRAVAERHGRLKDLAASFPALLFALAVPRAGCAVDLTIARAIEGAPLRELAALAGVPLWLRPVGAASFGGPLPALPDGDLFRRQIGNALPALPRQFDEWVNAVGDAYAWVDEAVALWVAREMRRQRKQVQLDRLRGICLWAWFSRYAPLQGACATGKPWDPSLAFETAVRLAWTWLRLVDLHFNLGERVVRDMWLLPDAVDGYEFVPLSSAAAVAEEAAVMRHCVSDYGDNIVAGASRIWSVRRAGQRVATLEIGFPTGDPFPCVSQVRGVENADVVPAVWLAARRWLNAHDLTWFAKHEPCWDEVPIAQAAWTKLWRPYWLAKRRVPVWLPLKVSREALYELRYGGQQRRRRRRR